MHYISDILMLTVEVDLQGFETRFLKKVVFSQAFLQLNQINSKNMKYYNLLFPIVFLDQLF